MPWPTTLRFAYIAYKHMSVNSEIYCVNIARINAYSNTTVYKAIRQCYTNNMALNTYHYHINNLINTLHNWLARLRLYKQSYKNK